MISTLFTQFYNFKKIEQSFRQDVSFAKILFFDNSANENGLKWIEIDSEIFSEILIYKC